MADRDGKVMELLVGMVPFMTDWLFSSAFKPALGTKKRLNEEEDESEEEVVAGVAAGHRSRLAKRQRILLFVENVVLLYSDYDFQRHFRLKRSTVELLLQTFGQDLSKNFVLGRPLCDLKKMVLLSIWTIANQESFRCICDRFDVGEGHAYTIFVSFCNAISLRVNEFISWPSSGDAMEKNLEEFESLRAQAFPGVVGCVDGSYIPIKGLKAENSSYHTRKGFRAINLQGICNSKLEFIDIYVGFPGTCHDARVWRNSPVCHVLEADAKSILPTGKHLLGDSAYPLSVNLLTPYRNNGFLSAANKHFNRKLSSTRVVIENAFGLLKSRFRRLKYLDMIRMDRTTKVVTTACVLHNLCIAQDDVLQTDEIMPDEHLHSEILRHRINTNIVATETGVAKRNYIAQMLFENL